MKKTVVVYYYGGPFDGKIKRQTFVARTGSYLISEMTRNNKRNSPLKAVYVYKSKKVWNGDENMKLYLCNVIEKAEAKE